ncbi:hypothetical protein CEXT_508381 [Caerostris extrusa]|uniref:Uncharacterized protein n=1 Tax=Caerostris extrusa TaxID=172846 RepID=A0AAV4WP95_CAEEX|nr:hypothetical protein CEXT_508381 [Caerostris extrusa]
MWSVREFKWGIFDLGGACLPTHRDISRQISAACPVSMATEFADGISASERCAEEHASRDISRQISTASTVSMATEFADEISAS